MLITKEILEALVNNGLSQRAISVVTKISRTKIQRKLKKYNIQTNRYVRYIPTISKEDMENHINNNLSIRELSKLFSVGESKIKTMLKNYGLKTKNVKNKDNIEITTTNLKVCAKCKIKKKLSYFYVSKKGKIHSWCRECNNKESYSKQTSIKSKAVNYKGNMCNLCSYNKYNGALEFHHLNTNNKDFNISDLRTYSWEKLKNELDKCVLLCANCHREIHAGVTKLSQ